MNQYSLMVGSFFRTGNYPLEANYIFETADDLKNFYSDELQKATLHEGLLKIVKDDGDGKLALYWVTLTNGELEFTCLISGDILDQLDDLKEQVNLKLEELEEKLDQEIEDRKLADDAIYGTKDKSELPDDLNSIKDLANAIQDLQDACNELSDEVKAIVGTEEDDIISYLETLDYQNLTKISEALNHFLNTIDDEDPSINTLPELKEFLKGFEYTHNLYLCFVDFWNAIEGDPLPNDQFRTLRGIQDFVETLASVVKNRCDNLLTELDLTQVGVGLSGDGSFNPDLETYHLKNATSVMNALKILDSLINQAINNVNLKAGETDTVKINIVKESDKTTIYADVKLSKEVGNDILAKTDGLYHRVDTEYADGILTVRVNGEVRQQHVLGLSMLVESAQYDPLQEAIIIVFKLQSGDTLNVVIPAGALISEWEVDNTIPEKVVELTKVRVVAGGADKLSADVRLSSDKYNIIKKDGNTLLVDGRASNIIYDGEVTVESKINELMSKDSDQQSQLDKLAEDLTTETTRAKEKEHEIEDAIAAETNRATLAETTLQNNIDNLDTRLTSNELLASDTKNALDEEITRAKDAENTLLNNITNEAHTREVADQDLQNQITALDTRVGTNENNISDLQNKSTELDNKISDESTRALKAENDLQTNITAEQTRATLAEQDLQSLINTVSTNAQNNTDAISNLQASLNVTNSNLQTEIDRAKAEEQSIRGLIKDTEHIYNDSKSIHFDKQGNVVTADIKVAAGENNIIKVNDTAEGIYATVDIGYNLVENKIWLITSAGTTKEVQLSEGNIIDDIYYDVNEKTLVLVFTANGVQKTTKFPVADLFNDWIVKNPSENSAIELIKEHNIKDPSTNDTPDALSARLLIADIESNAAQIVANGLFVSNKETVANTKAIEDLQSKQATLESSISEEVERAKAAETDLGVSITSEQIRAEAAEQILDHKIDNTSQILTLRIDGTDLKLSDLDTYTKAELAKKLESVLLIKNDDLSYTILVDGTSIGVINIPKDQFLESVTLNGNVLHFVFITSTGYSTTDIDLTKILLDALQDTVGNVSDMKALLDKTVENLNNEITRATHREDLLEKSLTDVLNQANSNTTSISSLLDSVSDIKLKDVEQDASLKNLEDKLSSVETNITNNINSLIGNLSDKLDAEINRSTNKDNEFVQSLNDVNSALNNEIVRAKAEESSLKTLIDTNDKVITEKANKIESDLNLFKADTNATLDKKINSVEVQLVDDLNYLVLVDGLSAGTITIPKDKYLISVDLIGSILRFVFNKDGESITDIDLTPILSGLNSNATSMQEAITLLTIKINEEISRAKSEESRIESKLNAEITRATLLELFTADELHDHMSDYNNPHHVTANLLGVYTKEWIDETLRDMTTSSDSNLKEVKDKLDSVALDVNNHINNTSNPHNVTKDLVGLGKVDNTTDLEKPISVAVLEAINRIYQYIQDNCPNLDDFNYHIHDYDNPHRVSKDQVGLGNVDNTSDMDKPISTATQDALNKKADIIHFHTKADITDLEDMPIIANGFVTLLTELPSNPARGEKYVLRTYTGSNNYAYELLEWDADAENWKLKMITTGGLTCIIDENVWKLNSTGPERILDASDYKYFYNKMYDETKDLIEDIDWEEDDAKNETNGQIRLKITYKTKYGDPDPESQIEHEVTNPYKAKAVKYIDIDKARFLANAYSRPATQLDIDKGYAATIGEPMLILVFTTGDYVAIRLNELMNIYDEIDTNSIDLTVTDWTGDKGTSYKISADLNIASTKGLENSISLHINGTNGDKGLYGTLHTLTTNSIALNPSTGTSGLKYLTADLKIDNALNNVNDVLLSISASGLSAQIVVSDYD